MKAIRIPTEKTPQQKASERYDKANTVQFKIKLNKKTDKDIIDFLDGLENKQGFLKLIIREEMIRDKKSGLQL